MNATTPMSRGISRTQVAEKNVSPTPLANRTPACDSDTSSDESSTSDEDEGPWTGEEDEGEDGEEEAQMIEMNLGLGVLEQLASTADADISEASAAAAKDAENPSSTKRTATITSSNNKKGDVVNFQPLAKKPKFVLEESDLLSRLPGFLELMERANEQLQDTESMGIQIENEDDESEAAKEDGAKKAGIEEVK